MNKGLILQVITFFVMLVVATTSLMEGIEKHETWRIIVTCIAIGLFIIAAFVGCVGLYRNRQKQA